VSPPDHQNTISVVPHFRPSGSLTYLLRLAYHQSISPYGESGGYLERRKTESVYILLYITFTKT